MINNISITIIIKYEQSNVNHGYYTINSKHGLLAHILSRNYEK